MYRVMVESREGIRFDGSGWFRKMTWDTWSIEDTLEEASKVALQLQRECGANVKVVNRDYSPLR